MELLVLGLVVAVPVSAASQSVGNPALIQQPLCCELEVTH